MFLLSLLTIAPSYTSRNRDPDSVDSIPSVSAKEKIAFVMAKGQLAVFEKVILRI